MSPAVQNIMATLLLNNNKTPGNGQNVQGNNNSNGECDHAHTMTMVIGCSSFVIVNFNRLFFIALELEMFQLIKTFCAFN